VREEKSCKDTIACTNASEELAIDGATEVLAQRGLLLGVVQNGRRLSRVDAQQVRGLHDRPGASKDGKVAGRRPRKDAGDAGDAEDAVNSNVVDNGAQERSVIG